MTILTKDMKRYRKSYVSKDTEELYPLLTPERFTDLVLYDHSNLWEPEGVKVIHGATTDEDEDMESSLISDGQMNLRFLELTAAPNRDFFFSLGVSPIHTLRDKFPNLTKSGVKSLRRISATAATLMLYLGSYRYFYSTLLSLFSAVHTEDDMHNLAMNFGTRFYDTYQALHGDKKEQQDALKAALKRRKDRKSKAAIADKGNPPNDEDEEDYFEDDEDELEDPLPMDDDGHDLLGEAIRETTEGASRQNPQNAMEEPIDETRNRVSWQIGRNQRFTITPVNFKKFFLKKDKTTGQIYLDKCVDKVLEILDKINSKDIHLDADNCELMETKKERFRLHLSTLRDYLKKIGRFRIEMLTPICALMGLVHPESLWVADLCTPAKNVKNGSFAALQKMNVSPAEHSDTLKFLAEFFDLPPRETMGEPITCEGFRKRIRKDTYEFHQYFSHLFLHGRSYKVMKRKGSDNKGIWEDVIFIDDLCSNKSNT